MLALPFTVLVKFAPLWIQGFPAFSGFSLSLWADFCLQCHSSATILRIQIFPVTPSEICLTFFILHCSLFLLTFMSLPQSAADLIPRFHTALYIFCIHSLPGEWSTWWHKWCDHDYIFRETYLTSLFHATFLLSKTCNSLRLPVCHSLPTEPIMWNCNKKQEQRKAHRKVLAETHPTWVGHGKVWTFCMKC